MVLVLVANFAFDMAYDAEEKNNQNVSHNF